MAGEEQKIQGNIWNIRKTVPKGVHRLISSLNSVTFPQLQKLNILRRLREQRCQATKDIVYLFKTRPGNQLIDLRDGTLAHQSVNVRKCRLTSSTITRLDWSLKKYLGRGTQKRVFLHFLIMLRIIFFSNHRRLFVDDIRQDAALRYLNNFSMTTTPQLWQ